MCQTFWQVALSKHINGSLWNELRPSCFGVSYSIVRSWTD